MGHPVGASAPDSRAHVPGRVCHEGGQRALLACLGGQRAGLGQRVLLSPQVRSAPRSDSTRLKERFGCARASHSAQRCVARGSLPHAQGTQGLRAAGGRGGGGEWGDQGVPGWPCARKQHPRKTARAPLEQGRADTLPWPGPRPGREARCESTDRLPVCGWARHGKGLTGLGARPSNQQWPERSVDLRSSKKDRMTRASPGAARRWLRHSCTRQALACRRASHVLHNVLCKMF